MATPQQLRDMTTARPFRPFLVKMASGQTFTVRHPENAACDQRGRDMTVYEGREVHRIEMLLVRTWFPFPRSRRPSTIRPIRPRPMFPQPPRRRRLSQAPSPPGAQRAASPSAGPPEQQAAGSIPTDHRCRERVGAAAAYLAEPSHRANPAIAGQPKCTP